MELMEYLNNVKTRYLEIVETQVFRVANIQK